MQHDMNFLTFEVFPQDPMHQDKDRFLVQRRSSSRRIVWDACPHLKQPERQALCQTLQYHQHLEELEANWISTYQVSLMIV
jgi:hypothetical protein